MRRPHNDILPDLPSADHCPICLHNHWAAGDWRACGTHRHRLQPYDMDASGRVTYTCPAAGCTTRVFGPTPAPEETMTTVATREQPAPISLMWEKKNHIGAVLPDHIDVKAFLGTAAAALYENPTLMKAAETDPGSLVAALIKCASYGHRPGTEEFYLTPRGGKVLGIEGYRGIIERMYRSGAVRNVVVREVCANDRFVFTEGIDETPIHRFGGSDNDQSGAGFFGPHGKTDRGPMVGVYAYARLDNGATSRVVILTREDVMAAKAASDAGSSKYSPWNREDVPGKPEFNGRSMWWKTAARRLEPWVPTSAEYRRERMRAAAVATSAALPEATPPVAVQTPPAATQPQGGVLPSDAVIQHLERLGVTDVDEQLVLAARVAGADFIPDTIEDLNSRELAIAAERLAKCEDVGQVHALIDRGDKPGGNS